MMAIYTTNTVIKDFLAALGLADQQVRKLVLTIEVGNVVTVEVERFASDVDVSALTDVAKRHGLGLIKETHRLGKVKDA